jgi:hypothetical protein
MNQRIMPCKGNSLRLNNSLLFGGNFAGFKNTTINRRFFMKNKILLLGGLCLVLALGLVFVGCDSGGPVDHPDFDNIGITVTRAGNGEPTGNSNNIFLVEFNAVEGAVSYSVVFRPVGKQVYEFVANVQYAQKYELNTAKTDFTAVANYVPDMDARSARIDMGNIPNPFPNNTVGQFGVLIQPLRSDRNVVVAWDDTEWLVP